MLNPDNEFRLALFSIQYFWWQIGSCKFEFVFIRNGLVDGQNVRAP